MTPAADWPRPSLAEDDFRPAFQAAAAAVRAMAPDAAGLMPRGIVIPAGGARMFTCAWVAVRMLRHGLGCDLPIQVWHIGPEEMSPAMSALLARERVETVDARLAAGAGVPLGGFELKSLALLHCPFREVILLDADNVPVIDPAELFGAEAYVTPGALFWPDLVAVAESSRIWDLCGVGYRQMPSFETGQIAVDRMRHYPALALAWFLNRNSHIVYRHIYGDKDCFLLALLALGAPFGLVPHGVRRLQGSLVQHHPDGRPMFQHRSLRKWKLSGENPPIAGFAREAECLGYLAELRSLWNGRIFCPPPADAEMRACEAELLAQRRFRIETVSLGVETVELLPHNRLQSGMADAPNWWLDREAGRLVLVIGEDHVLNRRFGRLAPGYWRSPAGGSGEHDLILTPCAGGGALAGHNSESARTVLRDWRRNYDRLPHPTG